MIRRKKNSVDLRSIRGERKKNLFNRSKSQRRRTRTTTILDYSTNNQCNVDRERERERDVFSNVVVVVVCCLVELIEIM